MDATSPHVRRVARAGVLALCDRLDHTPGRTLYAEGKARFETADERVEITPPFRFEHWENAERIDTAPLREHLTAPRLVGLLVVRLGGYGAGVYEDERLINGKHGVRFVKNRNKKGGSSSNRFRRRRVEQARDAYDRACAVAEQVLAPQAGRFDEFVLAGDRLGLEQVIERSRLLTGLSAHALTLPVHVPEVRRALLEQFGRELWSSTVELSRQAGPDVQVSSGSGRVAPGELADRLGDSIRAGLAVHREHVLGVLLARARVVVGAGEGPVVAHDELRVQEVVHRPGAPRDAALAPEVRVRGDEAKGRRLPRGFRHRSPLPQARPASGCDR